MQTYQDRKQVALKVLQQISKFASDRDERELAGELDREADHLRSGELNVVVCGECKRGKSTLLNAFLEEEDLCPTDAPIATNTITQIRYGDEERIVVHFQEADGKTSFSEISRAEIRKYVTEQGNARNARRVQLVEIWLNNPKLKDGLVLTDTPGVGSLNVEHTAVTYSIIPYADAVLFVGAANEPLTIPELEFCARIAKHTQNVMHILTKRDAVGNWQDVLRDNLMKLRTVFNHDIPGIAVNSIVKLEYARSGDEDDLELSGFPEFERAVWDLLSQRSEILICRAVVRALPAISRLRLPPEAEFERLTASSPQQLKAFEESLKAKTERMEELKSNPSLWMNELNRRMSLLQGSCDTWLGDEFGSVHRSLAAYLRIGDYVKDPNKLGDMLTVDCNNGFAIVAEKIAIELGQIVMHLRAMTRLEGIEGGKASLPGVVNLDVATQSDSSGKSVIGAVSGVGRMCTIHSMGLGTAGGLVGGVIGAIIGTIAAPGVGTVAGMQIGASVAGGLAGIVGGIFGIKRGIAELEEKNLAALRQDLGAACREELLKAQRTISHELHSMLTNARAEIYESLLKEIKNDLLACEKAKSQMQKDYADVETRKRDLRNDLKLLGNFESTMSELVNQPAAETASATA